MQLILQEHPLLLEDKPQNVSLLVSIRVINTYHKIRLSRSFNRHIGGTDGRMDGRPDGRTDERMGLPIEVQGRI